MCPATIGAAFTAAQIWAIPEDPVITAASEETVVLPAEPADLAGDPAALAVPEAAGEEPGAAALAEEGDSFQKALLL